MLMFFFVGLYAHSKDVCIFGVVFSSLGGTADQLSSPKVLWSSSNFIDVSRGKGVSWKCQSFSDIEIFLLRVS